MHPLRLLVSTRDILHPIELAFMRDPIAYVPVPVEQGQCLVVWLFGFISHQSTNHRGRLSLESVEIMILCFNIACSSSISCSKSSFARLSSSSKHQRQAIHSDITPSKFFTQLRHYHNVIVLKAICLLRISQMSSCQRFFFKYTLMRCILATMCFQERKLSGHTGIVTAQTQLCHGIESWRQTRS